MVLLRILTLHNYLSFCQCRIIVKYLLYLFLLVRLSILFFKGLLFLLSVLSFFLFFLSCLSFCPVFIYVQSFFLSCLSFSRIISVLWLCRTFFDGWKKSVCFARKIRSDEKNPKKTRKREKKKRKKKGGNREAAKAETAAKKWGKLFWGKSSVFSFQFSVLSFPVFSFKFLVFEGNWKNRW